MCLEIKNRREQYKYKLFSHFKNEKKSFIKELLVQNNQIKVLKLNISFEFTTNVCNHFESSIIKINSY